MRKRSCLNSRNTHLIMAGNTAIILLAYQKGMYKNTDYLLNDLYLCFSKSNIKKIHIYIDLINIYRYNLDLASFLNRIFSKANAIMQSTKLKIIFHYCSSQLSFISKESGDAYELAFKNLKRMYPKIESLNTNIDQYSINSEDNDKLSVFYFYEENYYRIFYTYKNFEKMAQDSVYDLSQFTPENCIKNIVLDYSKNIGGDNK